RIARCAAAGGDVHRHAVGTNRHHAANAVLLIAALDNQLKGDQVLRRVGIERGIAGVLRFLRFLLSLFAGLAVLITRLFWPTDRSLKRQLLQTAAGDFDILLFF